MPEWIWHWLGYAVVLLAFVGVLWAFFWDRPRGRKRCRRCWYDMAGAPTEEQDLPADCPECGKAHSKPKHLTRTRRRWVRAVALMLVMVVGGYGLWVVPRVVEEGRPGLVPDAALPWAVWHVRLNKMPQDERWQAAYLRAADREQTLVDRKSKASAMRWWLRLGFVDPSGLYGRSDFKTTADVMADPYGFTMAGLVFQNGIRIVDLPQRARLKRLEMELQFISLIGRIEAGDDGSRLAHIEIGGASLDFNAGTHDWSIEVEPIDDGSGSLIIQEFVTSAMDHFAMSRDAPMTDEQRIAAGWTVETSPFAGQTWTKPGVLVLTESSPRKFPAKLNFTFQQEHIGTFDAMFVERPAGQSYPPSDHLEVDQITRVE